LTAMQWMRARVACISTAIKLCESSGTLTHSGYTEPAGRYDGEAVLAILGLSRLNVARVESLLAAVAVAKSQWRRGHSPAFSRALNPIHQGGVSGRIVELTDRHVSWTRHKGEKELSASRLAGVKAPDNGVGRHQILASSTSHPRSLALDLEERPVSQL
jgi:hypothetical protein